MYKKKYGKNVYSILYIHSFTLRTAHTYSETIRFQQMSVNTDMLESTADKLRYHRHRIGFYQKQVANYLSISVNQYKELESIGHTQYYPVEILNRLAILFEIDVTELMDEYNLFLYKGQSSQIKKLRCDLNLTQHELAVMLNTTRNVIRNWEKDYARITKSSYKKIKMLLDKFDC